MESIAPPSKSDIPINGQDYGWPIDVIAVIRIALASSLLVVIYSAANTLGPDVNPLEIALAFYALYGLLHCFPLGGRVQSTVKNQAHWIDVGWFGLFLMLSKGSDLILLPGFLLAIIVATHGRNTMTALRVAAVSLSLILIDLVFDVGFVPLPSWRNAESSSHLLLYAFLLLIGFLLSRRRTVESLLARRLKFMNNVLTLSNPRFGVDRTLGSVMEQVRTFYEAEACLLVMFDTDIKKHVLRRSDVSNAEKAMRSEEISDDLARQFLDGLGRRSILYTRKWRGTNKIYSMPEAGDDKVETNTAQRCGELATLLDAESFISVPVVCHGEMSGRIYVAARRNRVFTRSDTDFLSQVIQYVLPVIENIRLVDRLASDAGDYERQRIARDIHDSVIQPYIGIQMGLGAVRQKLATGKFDVNQDVDRLIELTQLEIHGLRYYVGGLSQAQERKGGLVQSVKRFAEKFTGATGIAVQIETETEIRMNDRLAAEVFQLIAEGLSNIRRHTRATRSQITIGCRRGHFHLRIGNEAEEGSAVSSFIPKSITARTLSLGGKVDVVAATEGWTFLNIEIPL